MEGRLIDTGRLADIREWWAYRGEGYPGNRKERSGGVMSARLPPELYLPRRGGALKYLHSRSGWAEGYASGASVARTESVP